MFCVQGLWYVQGQKDMQKGSGTESMSPGTHAQAASTGHPLYNSPHENSNIGLARQKPR